MPVVPALQNKITHFRPVTGIAWSNVMRPRYFAVYCWAQRINGLAFREAFVFPAQGRVYRVNMLRDTLSPTPTMNTYMWTTRHLLGINGHTPS